MSWWPTNLPTPQRRRSYLCPECQVLEENVVIDVIRCWNCGSEQLIMNQTPRTSNAASGPEDPF